MILYPAIDIKNGKCVRLVQGREDKVKEYSDDPVRMALHWEREGAEWLHVVDLDAAISEDQRNDRVIGEILQVVGIPVQRGGGIRTLGRIEAAIAQGSSRVVVGTAAVEDPAMLHSAVERLGDYLAVSIDVIGDRVSTRGWKRETDIEPVALAKKLACIGVATFVVTDISQDGMLRGPNYALAERIATATKASVILSGGVASLDDLGRARALEDRGVDGIIIGKALYENRFSLREALAVTSRKTTSR